MEEQKTLKDELEENGVVTKPEKSFLEELKDLQKSIGKVVKTADNPYFKSKYADLNALMDIIKPQLDKNGWILVQTVDEDFLNTKLHHLRTNQGIESNVHLLTAKPDMQQLGSAITYARRYALLAMLNIETIDDDGNLASGKEVPNKTQEILNALENFINAINTKEDLQKFYNEYKANFLILPVKQEFNTFITKRKEELCK